MEFVNYFVFKSGLNFIYCALTRLSLILLLNSKTKMLIIQNISETLEDYTKIFDHIGIQFSFAHCRD